MNKFIWLVFIAAALSQKTVLIAEDRLSDSLSSRDLDTNCSAKFLEIHMESSSTGDAGMAIMKLFWMVDSGFLKEAAAKVEDPSNWGLKLGGPGLRKRRRLS